MKASTDFELDSIMQEKPGGYRKAAFTLGDEEDQRAPRVRYATWPPHMIVDPHRHPVDYCEIILKGSQRVGSTWHHEGHVRVVKGGTGYGPLEAGPEGCTFIVIFAGGDTATTFLPTTRKHPQPVRIPSGKRSG